MKVSIVGASGYSGGELLRLLLNHPKFKIDSITANSNAGEAISNLHPALTAFQERKFESVNIEKLNQSDFVFLALPHGESRKIANQISKDVKIVDLGADHRLQDKAKWQKYYSGDFAPPWFYSIPELVDQKELGNQTRVANPGCYATAIALAIAPAIDEVDSSDIVTIAASGTTGAGRSAKVNLLGSEVMNNLSSYKFGGTHQHTPEIEQMLSQYFSRSIGSAKGNPPVKVSFTPVLAPMPRGILATVTAKLINQTNLKSIDPFRSKYAKVYSKSSFVKLLEPNQLPNTRAVLGTNNALIQIAIDEHTNRLVISCAIDNLGKGAAGQAIQNANIMAGLAEDSGLKQVGL
jgi:N-acetyl-gamma-glutamyl-phosphate reductase